jgi:hypothetical protein
LKPASIRRENCVDCLDDTNHLSEFVYLLVLMDLLMYSFKKFVNGTCTRSVTLKILFIHVKKKKKTCVCALTVQCLVAHLQSCNFIPF